MSTARLSFMLEIGPTAFVAADATLSFGPWWAFTFLFTLRCVIGAIKGQ